ncbi:MAG: ABC transporter ATP-binding protein [bacterium]|nr:ABC transporter ATP-binding protein [bacterium]
MGILELRGVGFSYGRDRVISDLTLSVESSEFVGLIGANGSGKSTILKLAAGTLRPAAGAITLWGKPIHRYQEKDRAKLISYLPQMLDVRVPFTVTELVHMGLYPYDILPEMTAEEAIATVGLSDKEDAPIGELSGGERRRAFLAMTLLQGAGVLLLDEPLANLDIKFQIELVRLLQALKGDKGISIVMALHDIDLAFQFDRVHVVKEGTLMASGNPRDVITEELLQAAFDVKVQIFRQKNGTVSFGYSPG